MKEFQIDGRLIGRHAPPYIVAELSANHNGSLERALDLIDTAQACGADAVKIQTYKPDTITLKSSEADFQITEGPWAGRSLYDLYDWAHTPWEWHAPIFRHARKRGVTIFSSPFDPSAVDLLEDLGSPAYKIASFEAIDLPLIRYVASTHKPLIISTGLANCDEIAEAVEAARESGCEDLALLHCVSGYPAPASDYNLATMQDIAERFGSVVGLSDHTLAHATALAAVALGAAIIEKHITLDQRGGGPDDAFSLEPDQFRSLCVNAKTAWEAVGRVDYGLKSSERNNIKFRRSLYFVRDLAAGEMISADAIRSVRPGYGEPPKRFDDVVGRRIKSAVTRGTPVRLADLE